MNQGGIRRENEPNFRRLLAELHRDSLYPMWGKRLGWLGLTVGKPQGRSLCVWGVASGSAASHPDPGSSAMVEFSEESQFSADGKGRGAGEQVPGERWGQTTFPGRAASRSRVRLEVGCVAKTHRDAERCVIASSTHPTGSRPSPAGARPGSTPPWNQGDPPCSFPPWPRRAAGSGCFWLRELRVSRTFLDNLRSICSDHGYPT